ncbi:hypothetical protein [Frankia sp. AgW1.1]|uniref:hypothetical protein n=1 Tax=Frankia sp. AgW1.1 TaxID=1836971 RepID=UPI001EE4E83D|nr:hypothetical protein [Frankia sp. AgW1.1]
MIAKAIVDEWWVRQTPRPAAPKFWPIQKIVESHLKAGWTREQVMQALDDCITAGWSITITTFENALRQPGKVVRMQARNSGGFQPYRDPDESAYSYPMYEPEASGQ